MDRQTIAGMTRPELEANCARFPEAQVWGDQRRFMDLATAWPLWEATCRVRPTWMLRANNESVLIIARRPGGDLVVVPSGPPAEAIQRAFLMSRG